MALRIHRLQPEYERTEVVRDKGTGFIEIKGAVIARAGVLTYRDASGEWKELRDPDVMHAPETLASYDGQHVLLERHPRKPDGTVTILTTENADTAARIGTVRNPRPGVALDPDTGEEVIVTRADIRLNTQAGVRAFDAGIRGFSEGYLAQVAPEPGEWRGVRYDKRQTSCVGNHLVLTANPRAGAITEVRMDTDDAWGGVPFDTDTDTGGQDAPPTHKRRRKMPQYTHKGVAYDVEPELIPVLSDLQTRGDALAAQVEEKTGELKAVQAQIQKLEEQLEAKGDTDVDALVTARLALLDKARPFLPEGYDHTGKTELQVKGDAIEHSLGLEDLKEGEIPGAWLALLKTEARGDSADPKKKKEKGGSAHTRKLAGATRQTTPRGDAEGDEGAAYTGEDAHLHFAMRGFGKRD